ncbi:STIP1 y and U box-containing protein 1 [Mortierella sp. AM989]|nr:STIP1 y and U box-containing protein 1 [Mortierella sp. AM989]
MTSHSTAEQHKLRGNEYFKIKAYDDAIQEYSTAIVKDPKVAVYYCNRANCFLKLMRFANVVADCERVVELDPKSAYELALDQRSSFIKDIVMIISEAKKQKWIEDERRRLSQVSETYRYLSNLVEQDIQRQIDALDKDASDYQDNLGYIRSERDHRLRQLETLLQRAGTPDQITKPYLQLNQSPAPLISPASSPQPSKLSGKDEHYPVQQDSQQNEAPFQVREVPDYFLDKITFEFMHDPVISTKSGISYERSTLLEHFSYGRMFDPVAQVPITERDIVPNRALKEACDDFLSKNGWAVDY